LTVKETNNPRQNFFQVIVYANLEKIKAKLYPAILILFAFYTVVDSSFGEKCTIIRSK
jgi:hypothetical protein